MTTARTMIWKKACPKIFLFITLLMIGSNFPYGCLSRMASVGISVARARAPKVSMIRLVHRSYTAFSGESERRAELKKTIAKETRLTAS